MKTKGKITSFFLCLVMCLTVFAVMVPMNVLGDTVSGEISEINNNDHWGPAGNQGVNVVAPVYVIGDCWVPEDEHLLIDAGTIVYLDPDVSITIQDEGRLSVEGEEGIEVTFQKSSSGRWDKLQLDPGSSAGIEWAIIEESENGIKAEGQPNCIYHSTIREHANNGITIKNSSPTIQYCTITDNGNDGTDAGINCGGWIKSDPYFSDNVITKGSGSSGYGIYVGSESFPDMWRNEFDGFTGTNEAAVYFEHHTLDVDDYWNVNNILKTDNDPALVFSGSQRAETGGKIYFSDVDITDGSFIAGEGGEITIERANIEMRDVGVIRTAAPDAGYDAGMIEIKDNTLITKPGPDPYVDPYHIYIYGGLRLEDSTVENMHYFKIFSDVVDAVSISHSTVRNSKTWGIALIEADCIPRITGSSISNSDYSGVYVDTSDNTFVYDCEIFGNNFGVAVHETSSASIRYNHIHDNSGSGIQTSFSDNILIEDNEVAYNDDMGISVGGTDLIIHSNYIHDNSENGIYVSGDDVSVTSNTIESNGENGIETSSGIQGLDIRSNGIRYNGIHGIDASGSSGVIEGNRVRGHTWDGVCLDGIGYTVRDNEVEESYNGIHICVGSDNNLIEKNVINNNRYGMYIAGDSNEIKDNYIWQSEKDGIRLGVGNDNTITENTIAWNREYGVKFEHATASGNTFYHNNFIDNVYTLPPGTYQVHDQNPANNDWHSIDLLEGNYWSDYTGVDDGSVGRIAGDGIGDTLIPHPDIDYDFYPLMYTYRYTPTGIEVTVYLGNGVFITFSEVTVDGITNCDIAIGGPTPPTGFEMATNPPTYYDITTTAGYSGIITIKIIYDEDTIGVDENSLTLMHHDHTGTWVDVTTSLDIDKNIITGEVTELSFFALMYSFVNVVIINPQDGETVSDVVIISGIAMSNVAAVISVNLNINGGLLNPATDTSGDGSWSTWEYIWDTRGYPDGQCEIAVRAIDNNANSGIDLITVVVDNYRGGV